MPLRRYIGAYQPADLDLLQRVFDRLCIERGLAPNDSEEREALALDVIHAFQNGAADEAELLLALSKV